MYMLYKVWLLIAVIGCDASTFNETTERSNVYDLLKNVTVSKNGRRLSLQDSIQTLLLRLRNDSALHVPGFEIPDPKEIDELNTFHNGSWYRANVHMWNASVCGLAQIRLNEISANLKDMNFGVGISIPEITLKGQFKLNGSLNYIWMKLYGNGDFWIKAQDIFAFGNLTLTVSKDGYLEINNISLDTTVPHIEHYFQNLFISDSILKLVRENIFNSTKPIILEEMQATLKRYLDRQFRKLSAQPRYAEFQVPFDLVIANTATQLREKNKDPLPLQSTRKEFNKRLLFIRVYGTLNLYDGNLSGLSSIHRTGDVLLHYKDNYANATAQIGLENLKGSYKWNATFMKMTKKGVLNFTVQKIRTSVTIIQLNEKDSNPLISEFKITRIEQMKVNIDGLGSLDNLIEFLTNVFANTFKKTFSRILENNVKKILQKNLNKQFFKFPF
ncbi:hypothetical protein CHUAL_000435 [Chamberlinius hualienensis]